MGLEATQGTAKKPLVKLWFPRIHCAFLQKALGRLCSCLEHAHKESVIASRTGLLLLPFHHIQTEKKKEKNIFETNSNKSCCSDCNHVTYLTGSPPQAP